MTISLIIELDNSGEGRYIVELGDVLVTIITRFNYSTGSWMIDIEDANGLLLLAGLMLVPNVDILFPYIEQKEILGGLVLFEKKAGDYQSDSLLGQDTKLVWFPPGTDVEITL